MTRLDRRALMLGAGAGIVSACSVDDDFAGGTRKQPKGGIGGTGIVGTLTDFGSLLVNGLRVLVPTDLQVQSTLGPLAQDALRVGHSLTIEAETLTGQLVARRVAVVFPLSGVLEQPAGASDLYRVAGIPVRLEPGGILSAAVGGAVAVSGVWNGGELIASRIDAAATAQPVSVAGTLRRSQDGAGWRIGALPVQLPSGISGLDGSFASAAGYLHGNALRVEAYRPGRFTGAAGALERLSVEGYLAPTASKPFYSVDGLGHSFSEGSVLSPYLATRTVFEGGYDGDFVLEQGTPLETDFNARRRQLRV